MTDNHDRLKVLFTSAQAIAKGNADLLKAKEFYAEVLGCSVADLEPME